VLEQGVPMLLAGSIGCLAGSVAGHLEHAPRRIVKLPGGHSAGRRGLYLVVAATLSCRNPSRREIPRRMLRRVRRSRRSSSPWFCMGFLRLSYSGDLGAIICRLCQGFRAAPGLALAGRRGAFAHHDPPCVRL